MNLGNSQVIWMSSHWRHWGVLGNDDHLKTRLKLGELLRCSTSHVHTTPLFRFPYMPPTGPIFSPWVESRQ